MLGWVVLSPTWGCGVLSGLRFYNVGPAEAVLHLFHLISQGPENLLLQDIAWPHRSILTILKHKFQEKCLQVNIVKCSAVKHDKLFDPQMKVKVSK